MAKQSPFTNPQFPSIQGGIAVEYAPYNPTAASGLDGLMAGSADRAMMAEQLVRASQFTMPDMTRPTAATAKAYYNLASGKYSVAGQEYEADDDASALELSQYAGQGQAPQGGDWIPLDDQTYASYIDSIRNPTPGRLFKKNFGIGVDNLQMLAGRGLQFLGAEETGQSIVDQQMQDLGKTSPYQRQFTDIDSPGGAVDWFIANLAQQGPNVIESVLTAGIGAVAGGLAGGGPNPFTAVGGAVAALGGKAAVKQAVLASAKKYSQGKALDAAEQKLLLDFAKAAAPDIGTAAQTVSRAGLNQARLGGAVGLSLGSNYSQGVADLYGESIEGGDPNRLGAAALGVPYALADTATEALLGARVLGNIGGSLAQGSRASRFGKGLGVGAVTEGGAEAFQEGLLLGINPMVDANSPEGANRLINSFAAGAAIGGPFGGVANALAKPSLTPTQKQNLEGGAPTNLLGPKNPDLTGQGELFGPDELPVMLDAKAAAMQGPQIPNLFQEGDVPASYIRQPGQMDLFEELAAEDKMFAELPQNLAPNIPGMIPGQQGLLNVMPGIGQQEMFQRMGGPFIAQPGQMPVAQPPVAAPAVDPRQGALQFSGQPEYSESRPTEFGNKLKEVLARRAAAQQTAPVFDQQEQQAAAQREAELDRLQAMGQAQRQLDIAQAAEDAQRPMMFDDMRGEQAQIFTQQEAPRPPKSKGDKLKKGNPFIDATQAVVDKVKDGQMDMFTQKGEPTVAAMKSAGTRNKATRQDGDEIQPVEPKRKAEIKEAAPEPRGLAAALKRKKDKGPVETVIVAKPGGRAQAVPVDSESGKAAVQAKKDDEKAAEEEKVSPIVAKAEAAAREREAKNEWEEKRHPDSPKWKDLEEPKKDEWRKAVAEGKATMALAEEISPPPKKEEPTSKKAGAGQPAQPSSRKEPGEKPQPARKIKVVDADGRESEMEVADVEAMKAKLDDDIARFQGLLNCLKG